MVWIRGREITENMAHNPEVPAIPGCYSQGETIDETLNNAKDAIESHLIALRDEKIATPIEESLFIGKVRVEVAE